MKDKGYLVLVVSAIIGLIIAGLILFFNYMTNGENLVFERLNQGEILAGIVIAPPTLATWIYSMKNEKEKEKKYISENALAVVKHYDSLLNNVIDEISGKNNNGKEISLGTSLKIEYIIETFNKIFEEWNAEEHTGISLNFPQALVAITSIPYPEDIDERPDKAPEAEGWRNALNTALEPVLKGIMKSGEDGADKILENSKVKYFSLIQFKSGEIDFKELEFKKKEFVGCVFSYDFVNNNEFEGCKFINCQFLPEDRKIEIKDKLCGINEIIDAEDKSDNSTGEEKNTTCQIIDTREEIAVNKYVEGEEYYECKIEDDTKQKNLQKEYVEKDVKKRLGLKDEKNEKKIRVSISKNYLGEDGEVKYLFSGWHSFFCENIETADYFVFCVNKDKIYYEIIFKKDELKKLLEKKMMDQSGVYHFYFSGTKKKNKGTVKECK